MKSCIPLLLLLVLFNACRKDDVIVPPTLNKVTGGTNGKVKGFFLLNEANMGSNKASLDYFDYESGVYWKNIFATRNPTITKALGDVGNDLQDLRQQALCSDQCKQPGGSDGPRHGQAYSNHSYSQLPLYQLP